jgi:hypothetical protein
VLVLSLLTVRFRLSHRLVWNTFTVATGSRADIQRFRSGSLAFLGEGGQWTTQSQTAFTQWIPLCVAVCPLLRAGGRAVPQHMGHGGLAWSPWQVLQSPSQGPKGVRCAAALGTLYEKPMCNPLTTALRNQCINDVSDCAPQRGDLRTVEPYVADDQDSERPPWAKASTPLSAFGLSKPQALG